MRTLQDAASLTLLAEKRRQFVIQAGLGVRAPKAPKLAKVPKTTTPRATKKADEPLAPITVLEPMLIAEATWRVKHESMGDECFEGNYLVAHVYQGRRLRGSNLHRKLKISRKLTSARLLASSFNLEEKVVALEMVAGAPEHLVRRETAWSKLATLAALRTVGQGWGVSQDSWHLRTGAGREEG